MACRWLVLSLCILGPQAFGLHHTYSRETCLKNSVTLAEDGLCKGKGIRLLSGGLRLRGGARAKDDDDSEEEAKWKGKAVKLDAPVKAEAKKPEPAAVVQEPEPKPVVVPAAEEKKEEVKEAEAEVKAEEPEATARERAAPAISPEMVMQMNEKLWEAAVDGNEPQAEKAIKGGANVNAFCRGPEKYVHLTPAFFSDGNLFEYTFCFPRHTHTMMEPHQTHTLTHSIYVCIHVCMYMYIPL
jgi:hypothetical protein